MLLMRVKTTMLYILKSRTYHGFLHVRSKQNLCISSGGITEKLRLFERSVLLHDSDLQVKL